jgi:hypothetical protein
MRPHRTKYFVFEANSMVSLKIFLENSTLFCMHFFLDFCLNCFWMFHLNMLHLEFLVLWAPILILI